MFIPDSRVREQYFTLFDHLPTSTWTFVTLNVDKSRPFFGHLPTSSCPRSFWTTHFYTIVSSDWKWANLLDNLGNIYILNYLFP